MPRVIAGTAKGRTLRVPRGRGVRPTADRAREALFSSLAPRLADAVVVDLYAGSGALGIEALSRGAQRAVLVERDPSALRTLRGNLRVAGVEAAATVVAAPVERFCADPHRWLPTPNGGVDLVFADPPYAEPLTAVDAVLVALAAAGVLTPEALVVVERARRDPQLAQPAPPGFSRVRDRAYAETVFRFLQHVATTTAPPTPTTTAKEPR